MAETRIRVLQLIDGFTVGGAERVVLSLAKHIDSARFDVIPCAMLHTGPLEDEFKEAQLAYRVLKLRRRSILSGPLFLADIKRMLDVLVVLFQELAIDLVHTHLPNSTLAGIVAARRIGRPVCATVHSAMIATPRGRLDFRTTLMRASMKAFFPRADRIVAVSEEVARSVHLGASVPLQQISVIPNAVDAGRFQLQSSKKELRAQLGLPLDRVIVISVGRLEPYKGYSHLVEALEIIPATERPFTVIAGDGPERQRLEDQASASGIRNDIRFLGTRSDIPALLSAADIFVLPSLWEGLPLAVLEAMAASLPAVVTNVGGNAEVIESRKSGLLVPPADQERLAASLVELARNPALRREMGIRARERFDLRFTLRSFVEAHERLYTELATGRAASSLSPTDD